MMIADALIALPDPQPVSTLLSMFVSASLLYNKNVYIITVVCTYRKLTKQ